MERGTGFRRAGEFWISHPIGFGSNQLEVADSAARPMELIALGLAGCMAMDIISIMKKKQQQVTNFIIQAHLDQAEDHPKVFTSAVIEFILTGREIIQAELVRSIELSATKYCPGLAMLSKAFPIQLRYSIFDEHEQLKSSGGWIGSGV